jgi:uncharacterized protein
VIVYASTKSEFRKDVRSNRIESRILESFVRAVGHSTSKSEITSWKQSMLYMSNVLEDAEIPDNAGVAIEYKIPQTSKRVDFILTGTADRKKRAAVIVELKQWSTADLTDKDGIVKTYLGGAEREVSHPSYQAWTYAALLEDFNEAVQKQAIALRPCAYLHNMDSAATIRHPRYREHLDRAPVFVRSDSQKLTEFIKKHIRYGDDGEAIFEIDQSRIRPSKNLADTLLSMIQGNEEFLMIDDQKVVYETALQMARTASSKHKKVLIVRGGPGTGKSVVAINLLVQLTGKQLLTQYVTKNAAPRAVYESVLTGSFKKSHISSLFTGSSSFMNTEPDTFQALVVDEAHRLNEKSGLYQNLGENQIAEIIRAAKCSVFFIDEDQRVTWKDIGSVDEIRGWAEDCGAEVQVLDLQSQFRCNGSDGYLAWLDHVLEIRETANDSLKDVPYEFRVFDSPTALRDAILARNQANNKSRMVAGYCWDWVSKKKGRRDEADVVIPEQDFEMQWNLDTDGSLWIRKPGSENEVGCIHTCQGLEVDYIGVIIGPDLVIRNGEVITRPQARSRMDQSIKGYKKALREEGEAAQAKVDAIIKNTYRTLMSRGHKGCYIYCTDPETIEYFAGVPGALRGEDFDPDEVRGGELIDLPSQDKYLGLELRVLPSEEVRPFENAVPIYDIAAAAGGFSAQQDAHEHDWVELPADFRPQPGQFVLQVIGESMNRRIPDGAWCLFRQDPGGTRNGKVVVVEHREIDDPDTGGSYTVKLYRSERSPDAESEAGWRHKRITLSPDTDLDGYDDIVFEGESAGELTVVGELVALLG